MRGQLVESRLARQQRLTAAMRAYSSRGDAHEPDTNSIADGGGETSAELREFDALVAAALKSVDTRHADPAMCRRFIVDRLRLHILELQEDMHDAREQHIVPYNPQEVRRRRSEAVEAVRLQDEAEERREWQQWCRENPPRYPERRLASARNEIHRKTRRLQRLEHALTKAYLEAEARPPPPEPWVKRVEVPWKMKRPEAALDA